MLTWKKHCCHKIFMAEQGIGTIERLIYVKLRLSILEVNIKGGSGAFGTIRGK